MSDPRLRNVEQRIQVANVTAKREPIGSVLWDWAHERINDLLTQRDRILGRIPTLLSEYER